MPILQNVRHEAFAQARAKGAMLEDAYEDAGFAQQRGNASRLAKRPEVAARVAELRAEVTPLADFNRQGMIASLLRIAKASEDLTSPAGVKETRLTLLEAWRLAGEFAKNREHERLVDRIEKY